MTPLLALGPHIFEIAPFNFQALQSETEAKWPAVSRFGNRPGRQFTGFGEDPISISGLLFPHEFEGAAEALAAVRATQAAAQPVIMLGWDTVTAARVFGRVVILKVADDRTRYDPLGQARRISYSIEVAPFPDAATPMGRFW